MAKAPSSAHPFAARKMSTDRWSVREETSDVSFIVTSGANAAPGKKHVTSA